MSESDPETICTDDSETKISFCNRSADNSLEPLIPTVLDVFASVVTRIPATTGMTLYRRVSCHRCGNIRKRKVSCVNIGCPHIYCGRCADKMKEEYGLEIFLRGCPVCLERCCCSDKTLTCSRSNHCYRKCPASKAKSCAGFESSKSCALYVDSAFSNEDIFNEIEMRVSKKQRLDSSFNDLEGESQPLFQNHSQKSSRESKSNLFQKIGACYSSEDDLLGEVSQRSPRHDLKQETGTSFPQSSNFLYGEIETNRVIANLSLPSSDYLTGMRRRENAIRQQTVDDIYSNLVASRIGLTNSLMTTYPSLDDLNHQLYTANLMSTFGVTSQAYNPYMLGKHPPHGMKAKAVVFKDLY